jgi:putative SOS response-associated peptidase YedK
MCGRYVSATPPEDLAAYFGAALPETVLPASFNVAPTNEVYGVLDTPAGRALRVFEWGLLPHWAKEARVGAKMINARADSVAAKPAFRSAFAKHRCIVPADGFYEWRALGPDPVNPKRSRKQPYYIHRPADAPLALAGLWSAWRDPNGGADAPWRHTLSIITTDANETMAPLHDRMPVILPPSAWSRWLDPGNRDTAALQGLLVPAPPELLVVRAVATDVNSVRNKGPHLIDEVPPLAPADAAATPPAETPPAS